MIFFASLLLIEIIILKYIYFAISDNETFKKNESVKFLAIFSNFHEICKKLYMKKKTRLFDMIWSSVRVMHQFLV